MARIDCYSAESFYFCGVKSQRRHEVAGSASVFRAHHFIGNKLSYPDECGRSNTRKVIAFENLTARTGYIIFVKIQRL